MAQTSDMIEWSVIKLVRRNIIAEYRVQTVSPITKSDIAYREIRFLRSLASRTYSILVLLVLWNPQNTIRHTATSSVQNGMVELRWACDVTGSSRSDSNLFRVPRPWVQTNK